MHGWRSHDVNPMAIEASDRIGHDPLDCPLSERAQTGRREG
jgi:hypothetical protein